MTQLTSTSRLVVLVSAALAGMSCAVPVAAQHARSTLAQLTEHADVIARVRVVHNATVVHDATKQYVQRVVFKIQGTLKGTQLATFELTEPAGRACGRALHGVMIGAGYLAFLDYVAGSLRLSVGSPRALVPVDPQVLGHVRQLLEAKTTSTRLQLFTTALIATSPRVRRDAATTLLLLANLGQASAQDRRRIVDGLRHNLGRDDQTTFGLIRAAKQLELREVVPVLLPHYLAEHSSVLQRAIRETITGLDRDHVVAHLAAGLPTSVTGQTRAIDLLKDCTGASATRYLQNLANGENFAVARLAREALNARTAATVRQPEFRSILQKVQR